LPSRPLLSSEPPICVSSWLLRVCSIGWRSGASTLRPLEGRGVLCEGLLNSECDRTLSHSGSSDFASRVARGHLRWQSGRCVCGAAREPGLACRLQYRCFGDSSGTRPVLIHQHRAGLPVMFQPGSRCLVPVPSACSTPVMLPGIGPRRSTHRGGLAMAYPGGVFGDQGLQRRSLPSIPLNYEARPPVTSDFVERRGSSGGSSRLSAFVFYAAAPSRSG
jgi:hypothetical protein